MNAHSTVRASVETITLPTYLPAPPDKNPMFLEKRVYQGSSGRVYPLPFTDRIAVKPVDRRWKALWLENEFIRALVLPEIGGRIHALQDKTNGYDLIYNQHVIKPALVGLAGPWVSGGIEFNWPQHHRPATFLPVDFAIEENSDGSKTIWCGDHDPMSRLKGMHGICLHPRKSYIELKVRVYNRTPLTHTFLWWANAATRVHEAYQSFFPPDVYYVADHAKRATSDYPLCENSYYGVDYGERGRSGIPNDEIPRQFIPPHCGGHSPVNYAANDLSFYANIPVPTSYMCVDSLEDFVGGYDYKAKAGIVHVANHHISPGKKQWTWGNQQFGYAWDRSLTDADENGEFAPYIEIMSGVFTDNQPDFSFLQPGETRTWSQFWYPIHSIGPAQQANLKAALSLREEPGSARLGICVTEKVPNANIEVFARGQLLERFTRDLVPGAPILEKITLSSSVRAADLSVRVIDNSGREVIVYASKPRLKGKAPQPATAPCAPETISSSDELYINGLHLYQYRHATRSPTPYWQEALRRDPLDSRCNNAMGLWHLQRGELLAAEAHFRCAIVRLTARNPNPYDGEAYYDLGVCLRLQQRDDEAYAAFYKATWNQAWQSAGFQALAELSCKKSDWSSALDHLNRALRSNADDLKARNLKAVVLRKLNRNEEATSLLRETLALDPLDWMARHLHAEKLDCDLQSAVDFAHDFARAGLFAEAVGLLDTRTKPKGDLPDQSWGAAPLVSYTLGWLRQQLGDNKSANAEFKKAAAESPDYCFPSRLEEITILEAAMRANPKDARAPFYLGNLLYDRRRHAEAIRLWEKAATLDPHFSVVWRNLSIGYFNVSKSPRKARSAYEKAFKANPNDARLLFERDQLWKRLGDRPERRLRELTRFPSLVQQRDDLSVELCALLNDEGRHGEAVRLLTERHFQPWEGGEGAALGQHVRTQLALGREALRQNDPAGARVCFENALKAPANLGEAKHLLANQSDIHFWLGVALGLLGENRAAREQWLAAAHAKQDFQQMSVRAFSEVTYYSALALGKLGQRSKAKGLFRNLLAYAKQLRKAKATIDYFTTSLPAMLPFEDDPQFLQETTALFFEAQAHIGLGNKSRAKHLLAAVLKRDPSYARAIDLSEECFKGRGAL
jgi:tetratricopeptide (TPR) repeat protein